MKELTIGVVNRRLLKQPSVAQVTVATAMAVIVLGWLQMGLPTLVIGQAAMAAFLILALYLTYQFPIHLRFMTKIFIGTVPLFLMAVLLSPSLAALVIGLGVATGEWGVRKEKDLYTSDIATQAGRWVCIGMAGSLVAHSSLPVMPSYLLILVVCALVLFCGDMLTSPLLLTPMTGEAPLRIIVECVRGSVLPEGAQYALGITGAILAMHDSWSPALLFVPIALLYRTTKNRKELHDSTRILLQHTADSVDGRDPFTHDHSVRVTEWTRKILGQLGVSGPEFQLICTAARVHDIGKLSLPDEVINKHEQLLDDEWRLMKMHPSIGATMLQNYPAFARGAEIVRGHHERWDGSGYPDGIGGSDIPFGSRVLAVADSFDAMTSDRPYRRGMSVERAAGVLCAGAGTQWEPQVVTAFLALITEECGQPATEYEGTPTGRLVMNTT